jgi:uncharacterized NAD(P)/FAD-binding protein YdhS
MQVAVIGLGPWGLCVLATLLRHARAAAFDDLTIHAIDANPPGSGAHSPNQPDYFLLNTVAGQVDAFVSCRSAGAGSQIAGPTFGRWLEDHGYQMAGEDCVRVAIDGRPVGPHDFVPRNVFGRYLADVYRRLEAACPPGTTVVCHRAEAVDIRPGDAQEWVQLADGRALSVDHVFLTTGHTGNSQAAAFSGMLDPYPEAAAFPGVAPGEMVAVAGMGLVAVDVVTALTTGRGGYFEKHSGAGLRYVASGREPRIVLFTRRGLPFCCRPATSMDTTGSYVPSICTPEAISALRHKRAHENGSLDFRADVLPLIYGEMSLLFYVRRALTLGPAQAAEWHAILTDAWPRGHFASAAARAAATFGSFDPAEVLFGPDLSTIADSRSYQQLVRRLLVHDCAESAKGEAASARKAAGELFRVLRDQIRDAVEFGALDPASHRDFAVNVAGMITRLVVGPPLRRGREFVALIDAGIVRLPLGPAPKIARDAAGEWRICSTRLTLPHGERCQHAIAGFLDAPSVGRTTSRLIANLFRAGRLRVFRPEDAGEGVDVDRHAHPLDQRNRPAHRLWVLGPLTEGARYFTHYLPSPKSRYRAFEDAESCVCAIVDQITKIAA